MYQIKDWKRESRLVYFTGTRVCVSPKRISVSTVRSDGGDRPPSMSTGPERKGSNPSLGTRTTEGKRVMDPLRTPRFRCTGGFTTFRQKKGSY